MSGIHPVTAAIDVAAGIAQKGVDGVEFGFFVLVAMLMVAAVVVGLILSSRDKKAWRHWLAAREWSFIESWPEMVRAFEGGPFGRGHGRRATFGFQGRFDTLPVLGFRYVYKTGSGDDEKSHSYQVLMVRIPGSSFPFLSLGRENILTRTFVRDTEFEDAEFNRMWDVQGANAKFTHDIVHPRFMEFLKRLDAKLENIWFERDCLLVSVPEHLTREEVDAYLRMLTAITSQIPPFVLNQVSTGRLTITWNGPGISADEQARRISQLEARDQG